MRDQVDRGGGDGRCLCATGLAPACIAAHGSAIAIDEGHELLGRLGEELKFAGVERFAQPLQQKGIGAIGKGRSQAAEEKPSVRAASVSEGRPGSATGAES